MFKDLISDMSKPKIIFWTLWFGALVTTIYQLMLFHKGGTRNSTGSTIAQLIEEDGDVSFRGQLDMNWLSTDGVDSFYHNELLSTGPDSKVRLDFGEDRYLDLESNTLVKLSRPKGLSKNVEIFLISGTVNAGIRESTGKKKRPGAKTSSISIASGNQKVEVTGNKSNIVLKKEKTSEGLKVESAKGEVKAIVDGFEKKIDKSSKIVKLAAISQKQQALEVNLALAKSDAIVKSLDEIKMMSNTVNINDLASMYVKPIIYFNSVSLKSKKGVQVDAPTEGEYKYQLGLMNSKQLAKLRSLLLGIKTYNIKEGAELPAKGIFFSSRHSINGYYKGQWQKSKHWAKIMKSIGASVIFDGHQNDLLPIAEFKKGDFARKNKYMFLTGPTSNLNKIELNLAKNMMNFRRNITSSKSVLFRTEVKILVNSRS